MIIKKEDIQEFIKLNELTEQDIKTELYNIYDIRTTSEKYVINKLVDYIIEDEENKKKTYEKRRSQLMFLKNLELPEQRSKEWYEMRKMKLTASSLASALNNCHFTRRDELLLSKIEDKPYESNDITEWGVKYEDIAISLYEELYEVKVLDFGLIPHPDFEAFGASPDGICDDTGNMEYVSRMVEIKCPPKRKFTKNVPPHYLMQVKGQLEVCNLDECDFFQVKIEEYDNFEEYTKDYFIDDDHILPGRTSLNYPKGVTLSYRKKDDIKLSYLYPKFNLSDKEYKEWIEEKKEMILQDNNEFIESKWWKITRYECTLIKRDKDWWLDIIENILEFYKDLLDYQNNPEKIQSLKEKIQQSKKRKGKNNVSLPPLDGLLLVSSDEEDN